MHTSPTRTAVFAIACVVIACWTRSAQAAQVVRLDKDNWHLVPGGKEVDAIYGDLVMRNDKVVAVIGSALPTRQLNLRVKQAQGCVLDLALLSSNNDQLTTYQPHAYAGTGPAADKVETPTNDPQMDAQILGAMIDRRLASM
jgi:hypothetical protein